MPTPTLTAKQAEQRIAELEAEVRHLNRLVAVWTAGYKGLVAGTDHVGFYGDALATPDRLLDGRENHQMGSGY